MKIKRGSEGVRLFKETLQSLFQREGKKEEKDNIVPFFYFFQVSVMY
jgi:hypothetical protein